MHNGGIGNLPCQRNSHHVEPRRLPSVHQQIRPEQHHEDQDDRAEAGHPINTMRRTGQVTEVAAACALLHRPFDQAQRE